MERDPLGFFWGRLKGDPYLVPRSSLYHTLAASSFDQAFLLSGLEMHFVNLG